MGIDTLDLRALWEFYTHQLSYRNLQARRWHGMNPLATTLSSTNWIHFSGTSISLSHITSGADPTMLERFQESIDRHCFLSKRYMCPSENIIERKAPIFELVNRPGMLPKHSFHSLMPSLDEGDILLCRRDYIRAVSRSALKTANGTTLYGWLHQKIRVCATERDATYMHTEFAMVHVWYRPILPLAWTVNYYSS